MIQEKIDDMYYLACSGLWDIMDKEYTKEEIAEFSKMWNAIDYEKEMKAIDAFARVFTKSYNNYNT